MRIICISARESHQRKDLPAGTPIPTQEAKTVVGTWTRDGTVPRGGRARAELLRIFRQNGIPIQNGDFATALNRLKELVEAPPATSAAPAATNPATASAGAPGASGGTAGVPAAPASASDVPSQDQVVEIVKEIADKEDNPYADALVQAYNPASPLANMSNANMQMVSEEVGEKVMRDRTILTQITDNPENPTLVKSQKEIALFGICLALADLVGDKSISMIVAPAARVLQGIKKLKDNPIDHPRGGPGAFARAVGSMARETPDSGSAQNEMVKLQNNVLIRYKLNHPAVLGKVLAKGYAEAKNEIRQEPIASELKKNPAEYQESDVEAGMGDFQNKYAKMMKSTPQKALTDENLAKLGRAVFLASFLAKNKKLASNSAVTTLFNNAVAQADAIFAGWLTITPKNYVSAISGFVGNKGANPKASSREAQLRSVFDAQANSIVAPKGCPIQLDEEKLALLKNDMLSIGKIYAHAKTYNRLEKDWPSIQDSQEAASWMLQVLIAALGELDKPKGKMYLDENIKRLNQVWSDWSQTITGKVFKTKGSPATILLGLYGKRMSVNRMAQEDYHSIEELVNQTVQQKVNQAINQILAVPLESGATGTDKAMREKLVKLQQVLGQNTSFLAEPKLINDVLADNKDTPLVTGGDIGMADMIISSFAVPKANVTEVEARHQNIAWKILEEIRGWGEHHHQEDGADTPYKWQQEKRDENPSPEPDPKHLVDTSEERENHEVKEIANDTKSTDAWGYKETIAFASVVLWVLKAKALGVR